MMNTTNEQRPEELQDRKIKGEEWGGTKLTRTLGAFGGLDKELDFVPMATGSRSRVLSRGVT